MERKVFPELRRLSITHQRPSLLGKEVTLVPSPRTVPSDSGTPLCPSRPRSTQPHRHFPTSFPCWCPWYIFSEAGVYPEALKSTQKPLKSPYFPEPLPTQQSVRVPGEASIVGSEDLRWSESLRLQFLPSGKPPFVYLPSVVCGCPR